MEKYSQTPFHTWQSYCNVVYFIMNSYYSRWFSKWAKKAKLDDSDLNCAITNLIEGKGVVDLGGNIFKLRIASKNKGKRGSYRSIIVYKEEARIIFISAFAKNEKSNLSKAELIDIKDTAKSLISFSDEEFQILVDRKSFFEITREKYE